MRLPSLFSVTFALALGASAAVCNAADWPTRPIRFIVPATAGGGTDLIARVLAVKIADPLKASIIVENKPGAEEIIGEDYVAKSPPDGYTYLISAANVAANPSTRKKLPFDPMKDLQPVAQIATLPYVVVINPKVGAKNLPELVAYSKKLPSGMNTAVGGTSNRLVTELFRLRTEASLVLVPYKGCGPAVLSVVTGETELAFCSAPALSGFVKDGRLTALAVTGDKRLSTMPDVASSKDIGVPAYYIEISQWVGVYAPANTPADISTRMNAAINEALKDPEVIARLAQLGADPAPMTVPEYEAFYKAEVARIKDVVVRAKIPPED